MATVTIKNIDRLTRKLTEIANIELRAKVNEATELVHGQAKALAPVNKNGGGGGAGLAGSIRMKVKSTPTGLEGRVYTNLEYAPYVEFGTGIKGNGSYPYKIKGLNLAYRDTPWVYTPDEGETFYYTRGQKAQPYMYPALKMNEKYIKNLFKQGVKSNLTKICKGGQ